MPEATSTAPAGDGETPATRPRGREGRGGGPGAFGGRGEHSDKSLLKPEMTANVEIIVVERQDVMTVPSEAVVRDAGKHYVTLIESAPRKVPVEVGISDGTRTELLTPLNDGAVVQLFRAAAESPWRGGGQRPVTPGRMMGGRR